MNRVRFIRYAIVAGGVLAALWMAGLLSFVGSVKALQEPTLRAGLPATDAIVVLTGGRERLGVGLELLKSGQGKKLLISGVHPGLTLDHLPVSKDLYDCCIALGHEAGSTFGNAEETRTWMKEEGYRSLRLVTANYHMPRSLLIFHTALPDTVIIPHPIQPDSVKLEGWWKHSGTASLLVTEYNKFLWAALRLRVFGL